MKPRWNKDSFSAGEAAKISGVSYRTIDYWARIRFIVPSIAEANGTGTDRRYSFSDLVALRLAKDLRTAGIATRSLHRIVEYLRRPAQNFPTEYLIMTDREIEIARIPRADVLQISHSNLAVVVNMGRLVRQIMLGIDAG